LKKKIAIYGGGGLGREVLSMLHALSEWEVTGFYDDGMDKGTVIKQLPVLGGVEDLLLAKEPVNIVLAFGNPSVKMQLAARLQSNNQIHFPVLIHPHAVIQDKLSIRLGRGTIITAGVVFTTDIEIGEHVLINLNTTVGHDVHMGDCSSVMPGVNIAGEVTIGKGVLIGSGANILNGLHIGDHCRIGAGSVVTKSVASGKTVVGIPARPVHSSL
jgi:sugar O-acyltransferase (sialic acid O-acetyltransferase NeuD family)